MFLGSYKPSFDPQTRRIALPKKIRDFLETNEIILSYGYEKCIFGFDIKAWEKESTKQLDSPLSEKHARDIRRYFFGSAQYFKLDDQGRLVIPENLLEYAEITKPVIVGAGDHFEIWEETNWDKHREEIQAQT